MFKGIFKDSLMFSVNRLFWYSDGELFFCALHQKIESAVQASFYCTSSTYQWNFDFFELLRMPSCHEIQKKRYKELKHKALL